MNDVGEPCAGEPHARFDGRGLETEHDECHRASPRPDIAVPEPAFDPATTDRRHVLLRTLGFSCNYRDGALIHAAHDEAGPDAFYVIGSEFAGVVQAIGHDVAEEGPFKLGDTVIADGSYGPGASRPWGVPTNHASRELQVLPATQLFVVPDAMPVAEAAAFSIAGQTAAAMVRRAEVGPRDPVLVTSGRSNTSLFCISTLRALGCDVSVLTTSTDICARLLAQGAERVFVTPRRVCGPGDLAELGAYARTCGGFIAAFDPFLDMHAAVLLPLLARGGRIVTCGTRRAAGWETGSGSGLVSRPLEDALSPLIVKQLSIIGNCLGTTADLTAAADLWSHGLLPVPLDTVTGDQPDAAGVFMDSTFSQRPALRKGGASLLIARLRWRNNCGSAAMLASVGRSPCHVARAPHLRSALASKAELTLAVPAFAGGILEDRSGINGAQRLVAARNGTINLLLSASSGPLTCTNMNAQVRARVRSCGVGLTRSARTPLIEHDDHIIGLNVARVVSADVAATFDAVTRLFASASRHGGTGFTTAAMGMLGLPGGRPRPPWCRSPRLGRSILFARSSMRSTSPRWRRCAEQHRRSRSLQRNLRRRVNSCC